MESRIATMYQNFTKMTEEEVRQALEAWDRDQGQAEKAINIAKKPYVWSPNLRNAAITQQYWRLRLRQTKYDEDY
jgi:hypothetical protein